MRLLLSLIIAFLLTPPAVAEISPGQQARADFREAVEIYQLFVVPRCEPEAVRAYVTAKTERDRAFVRSLRNRTLLADYKKVVADHAARERHLVVHCFGPPSPPPPPPPPPGTMPIAPPPEVREPDEREKLAQHFTAGDQQFEKMVQLRDAALASPKP